MHGVLHKAIDQAVRWNLVTRNVADLVDPPRRSSKEVSALSPSEALRLLAAARGERLEGLYALAITGGDGGESVSTTPHPRAHRSACTAATLERVRGRLGGLTESVRTGLLAQSQPPAPQPRVSVSGLRGPFSTASRSQRSLRWLLTWLSGVLHTGGACWQGRTRHNNNSASFQALPCRAMSLRG